MIALNNDNAAPPHGRTGYKMLQCATCSATQRVCSSATRCLCPACVAAGRTLPTAANQNLPGFITPSDPTIRTTIRKPASPSSSAQYNAKSSAHSIT